MTTLNVLYNFTFSLDTGYNQLVLPQNVQVYEGNFLFLTQLSGRVAVDTSGSAMYSDLQLQSSFWSKLNLLSNWRFYLNPITDNSFYLATISLSYKYPNIGSYLVSVLDSNSNLLFKDTISLSSCKITQNLYKD